MSNYKDYLKKHRTPKDVVQFLSVGNAWLLTQVDDEDNVPENLENELIEFYMYFMENIMNDTIYDAIIENWGQDDPLIFRMTQKAIMKRFERMCIEYISNHDIPNTYELLKEKLLSLKGNFVSLSFVFSDVDDCGPLQFDISIKNKSLTSEALIYLKYSVIKATQQDSTLFCHLYSEDKELIFGYQFNHGVIRPIKVPLIRKAYCTSPDGSYIPPQDNCDFTMIRLC